MKLPIPFFLTLVICISLNAVTSFGQIEASGKYILKRGTDSNYILLKADNSFKYHYLNDMQWDLACGQYERKGDTILFHYTSDMFNLQCNNEKINYSDTSGVYTGTIDKRFRPISARLYKRTIMTIKTGDIQEPKTVLSWNHYYTMEKNRNKRHSSLTHNKVKRE